jgi:GTP pyrophosphokinase
MATLRIGTTETDHRKAEDNKKIAVDAEEETATVINENLQEIFDSYLNDILHQMPSLSPADKDLIDRAFRWGQHAHEGQFRDSGKPFFIHPLAVGLVLAEMHLDPVTIAAALLHDTVEDTELTQEEIEQEFGQHVARLVHGLTKIDQLPTEMGEMRHGKGGDKQAEYLRQMFMAMGNDVRVILIKLADRLDNMRTLGALSAERQIRNARETMDIFAPLANRLGIGHLKWQLEDLAFRYLEPERYREIAGHLAARRRDREENLQALKEKLDAVLRSYGIDAQVYGRPKHIYSIYRKMDRKQRAFDQIFDVRALRVMVKDIPTCYQVLGIIHNLWRPISGEFDDYIATPKDNGYQSLHTAVIDDLGKTLEVQIRTVEMHQDAEYGIAAHWKYKEADRHSDSAFEQRINYMRRMLENANADNSDATSFVEDIKQTISEDRVYVFTPRGDIFDLPTGSTPIDFAYHIHTEVGNRCRGAKVNGRMVPLDYQLKTSERVEIITTKRGGPSLDWLNEDLGYVKTHRARAKIKQWFRKQDREKNITSGRDALERELKRLSMEDYSRTEIANKTGFEGTERMFAAIGYGDITAVNLVSRLIDLDRRTEEAQKELVASAPTPGVETDRGVNITGTGGLLVKLANCCHPAPGDAIVGFITRGTGVTIHRADCKNIVHTSEPERLIQVSWGRPKTNVYPVPIEIKAHDRGGLMRDVGAVIAGENINMTNVNIKSVDQLAIFSLVMEVADVAQLSRILNKLDQLPEVIEVRRLKI